MGRGPRGGGGSAARNLQSQTLYCTYNHKYNCAFKPPKSPKWVVSRLITVVLSTYEPPSTPNSASMLDGIGCFKGVRAPSMELLVFVFDNPPSLLLGFRVKGLGFDQILLFAFYF